MHLTTLITSLATVLAATAIPVASGKPSPTPSISKALISRSSSALATAIPVASGKPSPTPSISKALISRSSSTSATAIPVASGKPSRTPSISKALISRSSSTSASASVSESVSASVSASVSTSASPSPSPNPYEAYTCPKDKYKSCCMSVQETSHSIIKQIGELVPMVGGIKLSSAISFQCKPMAEKEAPATCHGHGYSPMCCDSKDNGVLGSCKPFEQVKKKYYSHQAQVEETQAEMIVDAVS